MNNQRVFVHDLMQTNYSYVLAEPMGQGFHTDFQPELNPKEMLELGVFGGKYMTDCAEEFPADWFENAKLCHERHAPGLNFFGVNASKPLSYWREKGWIHQKTTQGVGFSGTADTTWAEGARTTDAKSRDGGPWQGMLPKLRRIVKVET